MNRLLFGMVTVGLLSTTIYAKKIEQTICFSKKPTMVMFNKQQYAASLGNNVKLYGEKCKKNTLSQMNKKGWKLIQVVTGLEGSFGMIFSK